MTFKNKTMKLLKTNGYPTKYYVRKVLWSQIKTSFMLRMWMNPISCYYPEIGKKLQEIWNLIVQTVEEPKDDN